MPFQGPDLGEQTLFGKIGLALLGVLSAAFWRAWTFVMKRFEDLDAKINQRVTEEDHARGSESLARVLEKIDDRLKAHDDALASRVTSTDHDRVRDDVRALFKKVEDMRVESAIQHGEMMTAQEVGKREVQERLDRQTTELRESMRDMIAAAARSSAR